MPVDVALEESSAGVILPVRAQPGARQNGLTGVHDGRVKAAVTQAAEKGKANRALTKLLAGALGLKRAQIELVGGATSSRKRFLITGISVEELRKRIAVYFD